MAAKIRGLGRRLVALTLMGWGRSVLFRLHIAIASSLSAFLFSPSVFAADFYWVVSNRESLGQFPSAIAACQAYVANYNAADNGRTGTIQEFRSTNSGNSSYTCRLLVQIEGGGTTANTASISRRGDACPIGSTFNIATGGCEFPNGQCESTSGKQITAAQECTYNASLKTYVCDDQIQQGGCLYTGGPNRKCVADLTGGKGICTGDFYGSGQAAGDSDNACTEESCTPPRDPNVPPAEEQCVTNGNLTICHKPQDEGCGTVNGKEGCFQEKPGCGYYNGTYGCYPTDKPQRNCTYFNGKLTCVNPNDPTKPIDETSPDHPKNGGNADGNENNDPKAPGDTSESPQGSDEGATNEALGKLGDELGDKIGEGNDLLGDIKGILEGIADGIEGLTEGLLGDEYDGSGDGDGDSLEGIGSGLGNELAGMFGDQLGDAQEEQLASDELSLDQIVDDVTGDKWFGDNSQVAALLDFAKDLLPAATACNNVAVSFNLDRYSTRLILPVCDLTRLKPLLEWIIYVVTAIGLWKIAYSTLRMEDAKASKGGF